MAKKKTNKLLEEQRRSREEFLKLKKMQKGELDAGPKPSEVAIVPKTFKEKVANYWFQYKWHTIGAVASVALVIYLLVSILTAPNYDLTVVYYSYSPIVETHTDAMKEFFEGYVEDVNGDGEIQVNIVNCSFNKNSTDVQFRNTQIQKLQAMLSGEESAMLFITDEESIKYFDELDFSGGLFEGEQMALPKEIYFEFARKDIPNLSRELTIACRRIDKTKFADSDKAKLAHEEGLRILEVFKKTNQEN